MTLMKNSRVEADQEPSGFVHISEVLADMFGGRGSDMSRFHELQAQHKRQFERVEAELSAGRPPVLNAEPVGAVLEWTEEKPTKPGWYIWFREEYDMMRREFFILQSPDGHPEWLSVYPGDKAGRPRDIRYIVGGVWYGPIPRPPLADSPRAEGQ